MNEVTLYECNDVVTTEIHNACTN